ncbi:hypothetical protein [Rhodococcus sp. ACS1]|uniref:hypothetical protein n=1 Tax=Rhodococcus sp. ACS1 TaxID=2028570 RepID=UPI0015CC84C3|nr:hypothetical protein [Rhodococcus sp. ACS1]
MVAITIFITFLCLFASGLTLYGARQRGYMRKRDLAAVIWDFGIIIFVLIALFL